MTVIRGNRISLKLGWAAAWLAVVLFVLPAFGSIEPFSGQAAPQQKPVTPGPLSAAHAALEGAANCVKCHASGATVKSEACLACHPAIGGRIASKKGVHRDVTGDCEVCHVEHKGRDVDLRPLERSGFDHKGETGFALEGRMAVPPLNCASCHKTRSYLALKPECQSCHTDPHQGAMNAPCASCHNPKGWTNAARSFHEKTMFPLTGRHPERSLRVVPSERRRQGHAPPLLRLPLDPPPGRPVSDTAWQYVRGLSPADVLDGRPVGSRGPDRAGLERPPPDGALRYLP